jgi:hypothetical protein
MKKRELTFLIKELMKKEKHKKKQKKDKKWLNA